MTALMNMEDEYTSIRIRKSTRDYLADKGSYAESMDEIILRLVGKTKKKEDKEMTA